MLIYNRDGIADELFNKWHWDKWFYSGENNTLFLPHIMYKNQF